MKRKQNYSISNIKQKKNDITTLDYLFTHKDTDGDLSGLKSNFCQIVLSSRGENKQIQCNFGLYSLS